MIPKKKTTTPSSDDNALEDHEQSEFVSWLEYNRLKLTAIPNSTYTKSWSQKRKNHRTGLRPGFPDLVVIIQPHQSKDGSGWFLCIEMKRRKNGVVSASQKSWIESINSLNIATVKSVVCKGSDEAIQYVADLLKSPVFGTF
jgi:hypothetical protein